ncbi:acyl-CoA desaturase [Aliikangiella sp. IMCC44632]
MESRYENPRIKESDQASAKDGEVYWSINKSLWLSSMGVITMIGAPLTFSIDAALLFILFTGFTLCFGHSLGMHRLFIHKSYDAPKWLEYILVHLGVLVGLAGPFGMLKTHDIRDWAQRQKHCHDYFGHQQPFLIDGFWQMHCDIRLLNLPEIIIEAEYSNDFLYQWMEKYWMWQQLPWAILFFILGGLPWVIWGICVRVCVSVIGHWLIGYFAHNKGQRHFHVKNAAIQGYNIPFTALITMGENWHNNHHAFPTSAKLGVKANEWDPGWWVLKAMEKLRLVSNLNLPETKPPQNDLIELHTK